MAGWVRNRADGSVELVAEGETEEVEGFLADLRGRMGHCIRQEKAGTGPATGQFTGFSIRH